MTRHRTHVLSHPPALAVLVKPMAVPVVAGAGLGLLLRGKAAWRDVAFGCGLAGVLVAATVLLMGSEGVWEQLVSYRGGAEAALSGDRGANLRLLRRAQLMLRAGRAFAAQRRHSAFLPLPLPVVRRLPAHLQQPGDFARALALREKLRRLQPPFLHCRVVPLFPHGPTPSYVRLLCEP